MLDTTTTDHEVIRAYDSGTLEVNDFYFLMRLLGYRLMGNVESTSVVN